jgi:hypothetical protein
MGTHPGHSTAWAPTPGRKLWHGLRLGPMAVLVALACTFHPIFPAVKPGLCDSPRMGAPRS